MWRRRVFQSTPPRGWRHRRNSQTKIGGNFNPLHHEGGDIIRRIVSSFIINFNPLHHEGGDAGRRRHSRCKNPISIHSTTRVETVNFVFPDVLPAISIHSTTRVETQMALAMAKGMVISIHSTTRVETTAPPSLCHAPTNFNPLHHEGGDHRCGYGCYQC